MKTVIAFLKLIRLPNLFSVPGDPLVGFAMVWLGRDEFARMEPNAVYVAIAVALCLYIAGLILNDLVDLAEDMQERPERPIPSGDISRAMAIVICLLFAGVGVALAAYLSWLCAQVAMMIVALIVSYNVVTKGVPGLGALNMGLCRGASVLLGAVAVGLPKTAMLGLTIACVGISLYIAVVTVIARNETEDHEPGAWRFIPALLAMVVCGVIDMLFYRVYEADKLGFAIFVGFAILLALWNLRIAVQLKGLCSAAIIAQSVGGFIRGLILLQAAVLALVFWQASLGLLCGLVVSMYIGKWFYAS